MWISLERRYTIGVIVSGGLVAEAPPIARWMIGKEWETVAAWCRRQPGARIQMADKPRTRSTTAARLAAAGFPLRGVSAVGEDCAGCGHLFGPHRFVASFGDPRDGGLYYCQHYPQCDCTGTWSAPGARPAQA